MSVGKLQLDDYLQKKMSWNFGRIFRVFKSYLQIKISYIFM